MCEVAVVVTTVDIRGWRHRVSRCRQSAGEANPLAIRVAARARRKSRECARRGVGMLSRRTFGALSRVAVGLLEFPCARFGRAFARCADRLHMA